jgi:hypothetical protein
LEDALDLEGLNDRQARIVKYRMRGLSQQAIATLEEVSQPVIAREMKRIRKIFAESGRQIDQDVVVGESMNLYEEVKRKGWELYYKAQESKSLGDANKALSTVMSAHERSLSLMMDLGLIRRAAIEHQHSVAPFLEKWEQQSKEDRRIVIEGVIDTQLSDLEEPTPPLLEEDNE